MFGGEPSEELIGSVPLVKITSWRKFEESLAWGVCILGLGARALQNPSAVGIDRGWFHWESCHRNFGVNSLLPRRRSVFWAWFCWGCPNSHLFTVKDLIRTLSGDSSCLAWQISFNQFCQVLGPYIIWQTHYRKPCMFLSIFCFWSDTSPATFSKGSDFFKDVMPGSSPKKPSNYCCLEYVSVGYMFCCKDFGCCVGNVALQQFTSLPGIIWFIDVWRAYQPSRALVSSSNQ